MTQDFNWQDRALVLSVELTQPALQAAVRAGMPQQVVREADLLGRGISLAVDRVSDPDIATFEVDARPGQELIGLRVSVGLRVDVSREVLLTSFSASGKLRAELVIVLGIDEHWEDNFRVEVRDVDWLSKPELKVGVLKIPAERLFDAVVERTTARLEARIREQLALKLDIRALLSKVAAKLDKPLPLPNQLSGGIYLLARGLGLRGLESQHGGVKFEAALAVEPAVVLGAFEPAFETPEFQLSQNLCYPSCPELTAVHTNLLVGYDFLQVVLAKALQAPVVKAGKTIYLKPLQVGERNGRLAMKIALSGDFDAEVEILTGVVYNSDIRAIQVRDVDIELLDASTLARIGFKLIRPFILNELTDRVEAESRRELALLPEKLAEGLAQAPLPAGTSLSYQIRKAELQSVSVEELGLYVALHFVLRLALRIEQLPARA